ncbi:Peptide-N(4)-(N-acetyl-beta-glucosaminyl)asparagine amidase [Dufourea novaeangliae]|uniref:Peptide-N(4)-(N-acetyl-beta-glucosaminyl)asparagine amidase n=1 Tax=Dufourea novaeangliae TaxID=178035 RepID=A0A154PA09_DUFNO|nr:Peptide-N(4)-(N-acetyl-beta-glucosaminyl)asparagine amidase [Dufourea novaeangliae]
MDQDLQRCLNLLKENDENVRCNAESALFTVCQNILSHPNDKQFREVCLDDPIVEKLLPAIGAMECLFDIGFIEAADSLILPPEASLSKLQALENLLSETCCISTVTVDNTAAYNLLPKTTDPKERAFLTKIVHEFQRIMHFDNPILQKKARKLIPITELKIATMNRIRELQARIKLSKESLEEPTERQYKESDIDTEQLFLMEVMHWFKYKFFTWVDSPNCSACLGSCEYNDVVRSEDPRCSTIEIHKCTNCKALVKFPRYFDPEPLLTLRRGRCGEWANVFTLLCRSLGYDSRFVCDQTDHVWTEVWSIHEKRWIHLDPCEDVIDRPLMYEKGWKKKLSYIIAYSKDEIQDVTWRYTRDQVGVMKRRNICSENNLLQLIESLNRHRQCAANYSASRREYLIKRRLLELVELIHMPNEQNSDVHDNYQERSTGSYKWRLQRGEVSQAFSGRNYSWDISKNGETFHLNYSVVKDTYQVLNGEGRILEQMSGWQSGVNEVEGGIFRKTENDWKMVYLVRSPEATCGQVKWNFVVSNPNLCVSKFYLQTVIKVFHEANVTWQLKAFFDNTDENLLEGAVKIILSVKFSGGQGDCAWQHAQIFRESLEVKEDRSFIVNIELKKR